MKYPLTSRGMAIFTIAVVMLVLAVIAVALRCFVRIHILRAFGWDDGLMIAAMVSSLPTLQVTFSSQLATFRSRIWYSESILQLGKSLG